MVSFSHSTTLGNDDTFRSFYRTAHVGLQFGTHHLSITVNGIDFPVIIKQYAQIVDSSLHIMVLPRTFRFLASKALQTFSVDIREDIEHSVVVSDTWSPDALAIYFLAVFQGKSIVVEIETVKAIGNVLPVYQILGVHEHQSRNGVHCCASQIVIIAHANHVGIREFIIE